MKWTMIDKQMPEIGKDVICIKKNGHIKKMRNLGMGFVTPDEIACTCPKPFNKEEWDNDVVVAWMDIPALPKDAD